MTPEKQIRALAELDGWNSQPTKATQLHDGSWGFNASKPDWNFVHQLPAYTASYDAIIPLIQKQSINIIGDTRAFLKGRWLMHKPHELYEALLRATGKWEDE